MIQKTEIKLKHLLFLTFILKSKNTLKKYIAISKESMKNIKYLNKKNKNLIGFIINTFILKK